MTLTTFPSQPVKKVDLVNYLADVNQLIQMMGGVPDAGSSEGNEKEQTIDNINSTNEVITDLPLYPELPELPDVADLEALDDDDDDDD